MIVVDASVLVAVLLRLDEASPIETRLEMAEAPLHAPDIIDLEVFIALRRNIPQYQAAGKIGDHALAEFRKLPLRRYAHAPFLERIWALRHTIAPYDAAYVTLAEYLDAPLLTRDRRLANAGGHIARIEVI